MMTPEQKDNIATVIIVTIMIGFFLVMVLIEAI